jgi:glycine/D-amino acid oxidase-like deaminating enzyme
MSQPDPPRTVLQPDVLILGGGGLGLWLLNDLHRHGYSALLLERRELGGEQTGHSHVYLHQGHLYQEVSLAARLRHVTPRWLEWLRENAPSRAVGPSYFGFENPADAELKKTLWSNPELSLPFRELDGQDHPAALQGGSVQVVLESPEISLDGEALVRALGDRVAPMIGQVTEVDDIRLGPGAARVEAVEAILPPGVRVTFRPKALVLAAGASNQALLDRAAGGRSALAGQVREAQQIRKAHMLVLRGPKELLSPLTGVFQPFGLFLVSRDLGDEVVWLVSDARSPSLWSAEDWLVYDERWWLPQVVAALWKLSPRCFAPPEALRWGVYAAPKAEGRATGAIPHEERIERFRLANLWAVWPTKLTLVPQVSAVVVEQIRQLVPNPTPWGTPPAEWQAVRRMPGVALERWRRTALLDWPTFCQVYHLV